VAGVDHTVFIVFEFGQRHLIVGVSPIVEHLKMEDISRLHGISEHRLVDVEFKRVPGDLFSMCISECQVVGHLLYDRKTFDTQPAGSCLPKP